MNILGSIKNFVTRNLAFSNYYAIKTGMPVYNNWTVRKAVKDGYKANGWVYRAVTLISKSAASVPWGVVNPEGEFIDHYLSDVLNRPNPSISRQNVFELLVSWLELSGNAFLKTVQAGGRTAEIWPVSPDRLKPLLSKDISKWIRGYALDMSTKVDYEPDEIIHIMYFDPSNPYMGIGPLQAVSKTVDIDVDQLDWNKAAMQNRGVLDGYFSFKREFRTQGEADAVADRLNEKYTGPSKARKLGVLGSEAKYIRTSLTPVQMDFLNSRRSNRDEIFIVFGVPPQYAGTQEASTYNNYQTSELIFWFQKIIPLLDDVKDTFNFFFDEELGENKIAYNLNAIPAIRRALLERSKTAKTLFEMGVPVNQLNRIFELGIDEYDGWEDSHVASSKAETEVKTGVDPEVRSQPLSYRPKLMQIRDLDGEAEDREAYSILRSKDIKGLLDDQQDIIFDALNADINPGIVMIDVEELLSDSWQDWIDVYDELTLDYALTAADQVVIEKRSVDDEAKKLISDYFAEEAIVLTEKSLIESTTVSQLISQIQNGIDEALTVAQLQQAITDAGIFSAERALRLSRTITGTAGSAGQYVGAKSTGATHKKWANSGFEVRKIHVERAAEPAVKIDERFSIKAGATKGPLYPLDQCLMPADRVNCFLPGTKIEGEFIKAMKSLYHGKAVEIVTNSGNILRVTGKHPIFSEQGLISADSINEGDNLIACKRDIKRPVNDFPFAGSFPTYENDSPACIEQIFSALSTVKFNEFRRIGSTDFHGDGKFIKGDIEIVGADMPLLINSKSSIPEISGELILECVDFVLSIKCGIGSSIFGDDSVNITSACIPSSRAFVLNQLSIFLKFFPLNKFLFRLGLECDTALFKNSIDGSPGSFEYSGNSIDTFSTFIKGDNPLGITINSFIPISIISRSSSLDFSFINDFIKSMCFDASNIKDLLNGKSRNVQFDDVVSVNHFNHSGFVYDVETPYGWLIANDIIVSNCRCSCIFSTEA